MIETNMCAFTYAFIIFPINTSLEHALNMKSNYCYNQDESSLPPSIIQAQNGTQNNFEFLTLSYVTW